ncbi:hypothetical protein ACLKA6_000301 [Drosophila palustris]
MSKTISFSICLLTFVALNGVLAQVPYCGRCPRVKVMDTFDLDAYMGIWYEYSKYPVTFELGQKCTTAQYENIDNSTVSVVNSAISRLTGRPSNITGTAKVIAPAELAVSFFEEEVNKTNYQVLGTDYDSYAVVYSCSSLTPLAHLKFVWILTREREPMNETIAIAHQILNNNWISQSPLVNTRQKGCNGTHSATMQLGENDFDINAAHEANDRQ